MFNKIIPWFIPTKSDQKRWYTEELSDNPREVSRLLAEFQSLSREYNKLIGDFESDLAKDYRFYEPYLQIRSMAQQLSFLWGRIEYKTQREKELKELLASLHLPNER